jgi:hypothetical protein
VTERPARIFSELSAAEAREIFEQFVGEQPARLAAFEASFARLGGPAGALDRSIESLDAVWHWFEGLPRPSASASDAEMRSASPPWWYDFHPPFGRWLGPELAQIATGMCDYFFACLVERVPEARWRRAVSAAHRRSPVFVLPGRGEIPFTAPLVCAVRSVRPDLTSAAGPNALRHLAEIWLGLDPEFEALTASLAEPLPEWIVREAIAGRFTHEILFDEGAARRSQRAIRRVISAVQAGAGVEEVVHEDRELVLVRAPGRATEEIEAAVASAWEARSHGADGRGVG